MKTKVLLAVGLLLGTSAFVQAATIAGSKHDLTTGALVNSVGVSGTNQTCVFCHAPHNALVNKLLWNRTNTLSGASFSIFTSFNSSTMRNAGGAAAMRTTLSDGSTSLLCLSCHSLTTAAQLVTNTNTVTGATLADATNGTGAARWAATTGNMVNITNDHPVGINYKQYSDADATALVAPIAALTSVGDVKVRLFTNAVTGAGSMECATCHSVHDPANGKFLAISNASSALCRNCHSK